MAAKKKTTRKKATQIQDDAEIIEDEVEEEEVEEVVEESKPALPSEKTKETEEKTMSVDALIVVFLALSLLFNIYLVYQTGSLKGQLETATAELIRLKGGDVPIASGGTNTGSTYTGSKAKLDFYVMSQCPYGTQVLDAIAPVLKQVGDAVEFNVDFIASKTASGYSSLHGQSEVDGNIAELCLAKYYPDNYKYMDAIVCMDADMRNIPDNWETCAKQYNMDVNKLRTCIEGTEGTQLLDESIERTNAVGARGSPTIYLNGNSYQGGRSEKDFLRAICSSLTGDKPSACADIPEDVAFEAIVINDKRCKECDSSGVMSQLTSLFPKMTVKNMDYSSNRGKKLFDETGVQYLPAVLFTSDVEDAENYGSIANYLIPAGDYLNLRIGSDHDPSSEICDNGIDDTGNGDIDCEDSNCKGLPVCLTFEKPTITFFVMSYCPYGNEAEEGIEPVFRLLGDKATFEPRYIYYEGYQGGGPSYCMDDDDKYCAMHGIQEANQNIRENCVAEKYGIEAWFDYVLEMNKKCSSSNADTCWTAVAEDMGYDTKFIDSCYKNDYEKYASVDLDMSQSWGASGSPTIFINGKPYNGGRTPEAYKQALCDAFDTKPSECNTKLEGEATPSGGGSPAPAGQC